MQGFNIQSSDTYINLPLGKDIQLLIALSHFEDKHMDLPMNFS